ncbi:MAG: acyl-ACP--UDP-N-acetylglucosamine O-acyltransferase [Deltaproteobacteria bacterium]|nr:acyl-ACP--UDP-N-acetylglucosamine O-acyltransferase [Deltaproteobacteria bacterium]
MSTRIHPTAIVDKTVELDESVEIGPYCIISGEVRIGKRCRLISHVVIGGNTEIGENNTFYPFCSVGLPPQDLKYRGEDSRLVLGTDNVIREYVTIQPGTLAGGMLTKLGNGNLLMACSHVAHDCHIGDKNIFANSSALAGHVKVGNNVVLGGLSGVHQFVRIGDYAFLAGGAMVRQDVPPFVSVQGDSARAYGVNVVGLQRSGFTSEEIDLIKKIFKTYFLKGLTGEERIEGLKNLLKDEAKEKYKYIIDSFLNFCLGSSRGIVSYERR